MTSTDDGTVEDNENGTSTSTSEGGSSTGGSTTGGSTTGGNTGGDPAPNPDPDSGSDSDGHKSTQRESPFCVKRKGRHPPKRWDGSLSFLFGL